MLNLIQYHVLFSSDVYHYFLHEQHINNFIKLRSNIFCTLDNSTLHINSFNCTSNLKLAHNLAHMHINSIISTSNLKLAHQLNFLHFKCNTCTQPSTHATYFLHTITHGQKLKTMLMLPSDSELLVSLYFLFLRFCILSMITPSLSESTKNKQIVFQIAQCIDEEQI